MKYNVKNLLKIIDYGEGICGGVKIGQLYTSRTIRALNKLEELEAVLATPQRTHRDIVKHIQLVKNLRGFYTEQLETVKTIRELTDNIVKTVEAEYNSLFETVKA